MKLPTNTMNKPPFLAHFHWLISSRHTIAKRQFTTTTANALWLRIDIHRHIQVCIVYFQLAKRCDEKPAKWNEYTKYLPFQMNTDFGPIQANGRDENITLFSLFLRFCGGRTEGPQQTTRSIVRLCHIKFTTNQYLVYSICTHDNWQIGNFPEHLSLPYRVGTCFTQW